MTPLKLLGTALLAGMLSACGSSESTPGSEPPAPASSNQPSASTPQNTPSAETVENEANNIVDSTANTTHGLVDDAKRVTSETLQSAKDLADQHTLDGTLDDVTDTVQREGDKLADDARKKLEKLGSSND